MDEEQRKAWENRLININIRRGMGAVARPLSSDEELFLAADAELTRLRAIVARIEDVEGMAKAVDTAIKTPGSYRDMPSQIARAVRDYLKKMD